MNHWEYTGETKEFCGRTLRRIRAKEDFVNANCGKVEKGFVGGWVEDLEKNVFDDAVVLDDAMVSENGRVSGNGGVSENGRVSGYGRVSGHGRVSGNETVKADALIQSYNDIFSLSHIGSRDDTTTFFRCADGTVKVKCGCFCGTIEEFAEKVRETHGNNKHAKAYMLAIEIAKLRIRTEADNDD